jgi:hypothetical protein
MVNSLRYDLMAARLEQVAVSKEQGLPMNAYFHVIGETNAKAMEELYMQRKKGVIVTESMVIPGSPKVKPAEKPRREEIWF